MSIWNAMWLYKFRANNIVIVSCTAMQRQKAVTAWLKTKHVLPKVGIPPMSPIVYM